MGSPADILHLTPQDLARRLRRTPGTLANWRYFGIGPKYIAFGSRVVYALADVEAWEAEHTRGARHAKPT